MSEWFPSTLPPRTVLFQECFPCGEHQTQSRMNILWPFFITWVSPWHLSSPYPSTFLQTLPGPYILPCSPSPFLPLSHATHCSCFLKQCPSRVDSRFLVIPAQSENANGPLFINANGLENKACRKWPQGLHKASDMNGRGITPKSPSHDTLAACELWVFQTQWGWWKSRMTWGEAGVGEGIHVGSLTHLRTQLHQGLRRLFISAMSVV